MHIDITDITSSARRFLVIEKADTTDTPEVDFEVRADAEGRHHLYLDGLLVGLVQNWQREVRDLPARHDSVYVERAAAEYTDVTVRVKHSRLRRADG
jgi:hypothetical protein